MTGDVTDKIGKAIPNSRSNPVSDAVGYIRHDEFAIGGTFWCSSHLARHPSPDIPPNNSATRDSPFSRANARSRHLPIRWSLTGQSQLQLLHDRRELRQYVIHDGWWQTFELAAFPGADVEGARLIAAHNARCLNARAGKRHREPSRAGEIAAGRDR